MNIPETIYNTYLNALLRGEKHKCLSVINDLTRLGTGVKEIYEDLFRRSLYEIGELWEHNKISVAVEHVATSITESLMIHFHPLIFDTERVGKKAVISCLANEHHQVGAKMVADLFEMNGFDGYFLGANTPIDDMVNYIQNTNPDIVGLSLSIYFNIGELEKSLIKIRKKFPAIPIIVGGQAFRWGGMDLLNDYENIHYIGSLSELESYIGTIR